MARLSTVLVLLVALLGFALAQTKIIGNPIPGYKTCDRVRFEDGDIGPDGNVSAPLERYRPHPLDAQLFPDGGGVSYPAPGNSFEIVVTAPAKWQFLQLGGVPKLLNGSLVGVKLMTGNGTLEDVTTQSGTNIPLRRVYNPNGTVSFTQISVHSTNQFVIDYAAQLETAMDTLERRLVGYGLTLDYVSRINVYLRGGEGIARPYLTQKIFNRFKATQRPHTITLVPADFISPLYGVELDAFAHRPEACIKKWYR